MFRSAALLTLVTGILYWTFSLSNWVWVIPTLSVWWGWQTFKDAAIGWDDKNVIISNRTLSKKIAIVKRDRIQDISVSASWIQRFRNLCSTEVYVASGDHGSSFSIDDIEESDGELFLNAMNSKLLVERELPASGAGAIKPLTLPGW
jgi:uncharacterized membrane protein YdbT with pleckstrin-like domain